MRALLVATLLSLPAVASAAPLPSVAVINLEAKKGVTPDAAELLTTNVIATLRMRHVFERVIGTKEIEALIGFEKQKQLLSCDSQSCMAELAGALGVDFILTGSLGRLGKTWLFNATIVSTHSGTAAATVSKPISGETEEVLLLAVGEIVDSLLKDSGLAANAQTAAATPSPVVNPEPVVAPQVAAAAPTPAPSTPPTTPKTTTPPPETESGGPNIVAIAARGVGAVAIVIGVVMLVGALGAGGSGAAGFGVLVATQDAFKLPARGLLATLSLGGGAGALAASLVVGLIVDVIGAAALGVSFVL